MTRRITPKRQLAKDGADAPSRPARAAKRAQAAETVVAELRHQIVSGRLKPGDKLHPENALQVESRSGQQAGLENALSALARTACAIGPCRWQPA